MNGALSSPLTATTNSAPTASTPHTATSPRNRLTSRSTARPLTPDASEPTALTQRHPAAAGGCVTYLLRSLYELSLAGMTLLVRWRRALLCLGFVGLAAVTVPGDSLSRDGEGGGDHVDTARRFLG